MPPLFDVKAVDRRCYEEELRDWLPDQLFDVHVHCWLRSLQTQQESDKRTVSWPHLVAAENPIEHLLESYRLFFPGKECGALIFSMVRPGDPFDPLNDYVAKVVREHDNYEGLLFAHPQWSAETFEQKILDGGFRGAKVYLNHSPAYLPVDELRIFDFLPHHQLDVLDRHGWVVMLHIPRHARLRDPVNLHQMLEIEQRYPRVKVIIAHVGRAYCAEDVGDAFRILAPTERMLFDFSANTNAGVFGQLLDAVGPKRVLFGSDLPITRMRMRRIERDGRYLNLVPPRLYGDVSNDPNMAEVSPEDADQLTWFIYEELRAFRVAADAAGLTMADRRDIFHDNARRILAGEP